MEQTCRQRCDRACGAMTSRGCVVVLQLVCLVFGEPICAFSSWSYLFYTSAGTAGALK